MGKTNVQIRRRVRRRNETLLNKIVALLFVTIGWLSASIDGDGTGFVFMLFLAIPLFFAKESWFGRKD